MYIGNVNKISIFQNSQFNLTYNLSCILNWSGGYGMLWVGMMVILFYVS